MSAESRGPSLDQAMGHLFLKAGSEEDSRLLARLNELVLRLGDLPAARALLMAETGRPWDDIAEACARASYTPWDAGTAKQLAKRGKK